MNNLGKNIFEIVNNMDSSIKDNNKFKNIFDNLDESVIIIQDQSFQIEYVNNNLFIEFKSEIVSIYDKNRLSNLNCSNENLNNPSKIRKIGNFIKNIKKAFFDEVKEDDNFLINSEFLDIDILKENSNK